MLAVVPPPEITQIDPNTVFSSVKTPATITGKNFLGEIRGKVDKEAPTSDQRFKVIIGDIELPEADVEFVDTETLNIIVPDNLTLGPHDVTVITPGGRETTLLQGLIVVNGIVTDIVCETTDDCLDPCRSAYRCVEDLCVVGDIDKDSDTDGFIDINCPGGTDCDDDQQACGADCYPDNPSPDICDGFDQDCDTLIDEDPDTIWFHDSDRDGYTNLSDRQLSCTDPDGADTEWLQTPTENDCDDDGNSCGADCYPDNLAADICDGLDQDCDGLTDEDPEHAWYHDADLDSYTNNSDIRYACTDPDDTESAWVETPSADNDCNDDPASCGDDCYPGNPALDICDGFDQNCNTIIDEDPDFIWYHDADRDGYTNDADTQITCTDPDGTDIEWVQTPTINDCDDDPSVCGEDCYPNNPALDTCDGFDQDCDTIFDEEPDTIWYHDADGDGYTNISDTQVRCDDPDGVFTNWVPDPTTNDCADTDGPDANCNGMHGSSCSPGLVGTDLCDGADNDCDVTTPDGFDELSYGDPCDGAADSDLCEEGTIACDSASSLLYCTDTTGDSTEGPFGDPTCTDNIDNDCDGLQDQADKNCTRIVYRSVGINGGNLAANRMVTISGPNAVFNDIMPANVGVGDVLEYQVDTTFYLAFITGRINAYEFTVQSPDAGPPQECTDAPVSVFRAYTSLANWENQIANISINDTVESLALFPSTNLITDNFIAMVSCYADGIDGAAVAMNDWDTGPDNYIQIYTPTRPNQVGTSQRHSGKWGDGYMLNAALQIEENYVRVDGLSLKQDFGSSRAYFVYHAWGPGEIWISNCFGHQTNGTTSRDVFDIYEVGNPGPVIFKLWNCIGVTESSNAGSYAFIINDRDVTAHIYNCTGYANGGHAFWAEYGVATVRNSLGISNTDGVDAFAHGQFPWTADHCAADDSSLDLYGGTNNRTMQTFDFVDEVNRDLHIQLSDAGARGFGVDLSQDAVIAVTDDIDGNFRPQGNFWDIGADEVGDNHLPVTGQTTVYQAGDDGSYQKGIPWPSPRFTDNLDNTITDNLTGLMWEKIPGTDGGTQNAGVEKWENAVGYCEDLTLAGHQDWRLPNILELKSLENLQEYTPTWLEAQGFTNLSTQYWSATTLEYDAQLAVVFHYDDNQVGDADKSNSPYYAWAVRDADSKGAVWITKTGQTNCYSKNGTLIPCANSGLDGMYQKGAAWPSPRFIDNGNQTITDNLTGLMWTRDANLMATQDLDFDLDETAGDGWVYWQHALDYVAKLNNDSYAGYTDWRLANDKELISLAHYGQTFTAGWLNTQGFINVQNSDYWTSSTYSQDPTSALMFYMNFCGGFPLSKTTHDYLVWAVRGGTRAVGLTSIGTSPGSQSLRRVEQLTMPEAGFVQSITLYHEAGSGSIYLAIYDIDAGDNVGNRLTDVVSQTVSAVDGWQTFMLNSPLLVSAGQKIGVAYVSQYPLTIRYNDSGGRTQESTESWSMGLPLSWGSISATHTSQASIYVTILTRGGQ
jgi:hypothetical protein